MAKPQTDPLADALASLRKDYGEGSIMELGSHQHLDIEAISTGSISLDHALGIGGLPRGRVTEIYGPEGSGKSTIALGVVAQAQQQGDLCVYIDAEHAVSREYAKALGVNVDTLLFSQPDSGEQGLEIVERIARTGKVGVIVVDSVAALVPQAEIDGDMGDTHIALQARLMSQAMRKITASQSSETAIIFINQLREKPGVMFGPSETQPGGRALKFYSSVRLDIRRIETLKDGATAIGSRVKVKVVKNKVAPPLREAQFNIVFGQGIDWADELLDLGEQYGALKRSSSFYTFEGASKAVQGREHARTVLRLHPEVAGHIRQVVLASLAVDTL